MLKYSIKYTLSKGLVRARLSFHSYRLELYTGVKATPEEWDGVRIKKRADKRNQNLSYLENRLEEIFKKFDVLHNRYPTRAEFKQIYSVKQDKDEPAVLHTFADVIKMYIEEKKESKQWEPATRRKYEKLQNHILMWKPNLLVSQVSEDTLRALIKYFTGNPISYITKKPGPPYRNTTVRRTINDYRRILRWAAAKNLYLGSAHENFEQRFKGTTEKLSELIYLDWDELMALFNKDFETERLSRVRDVFCFCCFSGLRFSDVQKLRKADIRKDTITISTKKTTDPLVIDLNDYSRAILDKYKEVELPKDLALPVISMDKTNKYLKEIGEVMGWDELVRIQYFVGAESHEGYKMKKEVISTHAARRTFVISALTLGIPAEVIIKWTGHKDFTAMKPYVKIVDNLKKREMSKFNIQKNTPDFTPETG